MRAVRLSAARSRPASAGLVLGVLTSGRTFGLRRVRLDQRMHRPVIGLAHHVRRTAVRPATRVWPRRMKGFGAGHTCRVGAGVALEPRPCAGRRHCARATEAARTLGRHDLRLAIVGRCQEIAIGARGIQMLELSPGGLEVVLPQGGLLLRCRLRGDTAGAAVEANAVDGAIAHYRLVVDVRDVHIPDVGDLAVIEEVPVVPIATFESGAEVAEAIVNTAIETDGRAPIARVEHVDAAGPSPPG